MLTHKPFTASFFSLDPSPAPLQCDTTTACRNLHSSDVYALNLDTKAWVKLEVKCYVASRETPNLVQYKPFCFMGFGGGTRNDECLCDIFRLDLSVIDKSTPEGLEPEEEARDLDFAGMQDPFAIQSADTAPVVVEMTSTKYVCVCVCVCQDNDSIHVASHFAHMWATCREQWCQPINVHETFLFR